MTASLEGTVSRDCLGHCAPGAGSVSLIGDDRGWGKEIFIFYSIAFSTFDSGAAYLLLREDDHLPKANVLGGKHLCWESFRGKGFICGHGGLLVPAPEAADKGCTRVGCVCPAWHIWGRGGRWVEGSFAGVHMAFLSQFYLLAPILQAPPS